MQGAGDLGVRSMCSAFDRLQALQVSDQRVRGTVDDILVIAECHWWPEFRPIGANTLRDGPLDLVGAPRADPGFLVRSYVAGDALAPRSMKDLPAGTGAREVSAPANLLCMAPDSMPDLGEILAIGNLIRPWNVGNILQRRPVGRR